ncbi:AraC family transcriptional regulator [Pseudomonas fuscovaginae UPB0736]|uniref:helix-turn-helix transcriptional regulator n=1 Tax=Pseudomonas asplenii TaxID=53407 RepID=UPI000289F9A6|nr:AraC family transcriptional regulator [Pseudomonas fuscovaginae]UUQ65122.1 AraC family transcriptional regulator [Pseudomonas fuscovaginae UPB0736]
MSSSSRVRTYGMQQRSDRPDFYIRDQQARPAIVTPHRHDYFQIQINLGGDTVQHIGGAIRPYPRRALAFILPHRLHLIPHPQDSNFVLINFSQAFFLAHLDCDPLDLEDLSIQDLPELSPFQYQEHLDFILDEEDFADVLALLEKMRELDQARDLGTRQALKGCLLQLTGKVCSRYSNELEALSANKAARRGRRDAMARVSRYLREHIADPALNLKDTAEAAFLSPNYLTHLLRKETGNTFSALVLERRMHLARTLLLNSDQPISQVARLCGFADEAYFSRRFKATQGLPPGQFRRQRQER